MEIKQICFKKEGLEECRTLNGCETGQAKITKAYDLPCDYVIHTVEPIWNGGNDHEEELLAFCYYNPLCLAEEDGIRTVAFPSISTGVYCFPVELAARKAVRIESWHQRFTVKSGRNIHILLFWS